MKKTPQEDSFAPPRSRDFEFMSATSSHHGYNVCVRPPTLPYPPHYLLGKVDPRSVQLRPEVIHVSPRKHERASEEPDEGGGDCVLHPPPAHDGPVLPHDLDPLHEVASDVVRARHRPRRREGRLALPRALVEPLARFLDLVGVVLVGLAVLVDVLRLLAREAFGPDEGGGGVGHVVADEGEEGARAAGLVGEHGAGVIAEEAEVDATAVRGAVSAQIVCALLVVDLELLAALGDRIQIHLLLVLALVLVAR